MKSFTLTPTDNTVAYYYDESVHKLAELISKLAMALQILALIVFLVGLACGKIIGI